MPRNPRPDQIGMGGRMLSESVAGSSRNTQASKRLNSQLKKVGIHVAIETTFHSTRHTAKDIMRVAKIDERIHDKQTGHSHKTVSRGYGSKTLLQEEIEVLKLLPLPKGLDLSPYFIR